MRYYEVEMRVRIGIEEPEPEPPRNVSERASALMFKMVETAEETAGSQRDTIVLGAGYGVLPLSQARATAEGE